MMTRSVSGFSSSLRSHSISSVPSSPPILASRPQKQEARRAEKHGGPGCRRAKSDVVSHSDSARASRLIATTPRWRLAHRRRLRFQNHNVEEPMSAVEISSTQGPPGRTKLGHAGAISALAGSVAVTALLAIVSPGQAQAQDKRPNIVMLMTDDTGWSDFGAYSGGGASSRPSYAERRSHGPGGRDLHQLVRPSELHRGPRLLHHRTHSDPLGAVDRGCSGRQELSPQGNADHRGVLSEERLRHLLLRQVAPRRQARILSDRAWLRRDEAFRRLLCRRLCLRRHLEIFSSVVPLVQFGIRKGIRRAT